MHVELRKTAAQVADARRAAFMEPDFVARQLEAITDAAAGRPEKMAALLAEIAAVKAGLPMPPADG